MKATQNGQLKHLEDCYVIINGNKIHFDNLPDIGDSKSATYNDANGIGRSMPMKTYSFSNNRVISLTIHFIATNQSELIDNLYSLRFIESAVYPREGGDPFIPPPVCQLKCGNLIADEEICCVLESYSVKFPTDVPWDEKTYIPWKFDVDTSWQVVYRNEDLPGSERIWKSGK
jgi:hypothetical protein